MQNPLALETQPAGLPTMMSMLVASMLSSSVRPLPVRPRIPYDQLWDRQQME